MSICFVRLEAPFEFIFLNVPLFSVSILRSVLSSITICPLSHFAVRLSFIIKDRTFVTEGIRNSFASVNTHVVSMAPASVPMHSASLELTEIAGCLVDIHTAGSSDGVSNKLAIDLLVSGSAA